jgi:ABC-type nitrate/sulfonate/bicarbonate transport system permease component
MRTNEVLVFAQSIVTVIVVWMVIAHGLNLVDSISSPELILAEVYELIASGLFFTHLVDTMRRTLFGFAIGVIIATPIGIAIGLSDFLKTAFKDYVTIGLALPDLLVVVFVAMLFGIGDLTPAGAAVVLAIPYMLQTLIEGVDDIDANLLEMGASFDTSRRRLLRRVVVPSLLPEWFGGVRYSLAISWKAVTLAEVVAAETGVGFMIRKQMDTLSLTGAFAWTVLFIVVLLFIEYGVLRQLERFAFSWREEVSDVVVTP